MYALEHDVRPPLRPVAADPALCPSAPDGTDCRGVLQPDDARSLTADAVAAQGAQWSVAQSAAVACAEAIAAEAAADVAAEAAVTARAAVDAASAAASRAIVRAEDVAERAWLAAAAAAREMPAAQPVTRERRRAAPQTPDDLRPARDATMPSVARTQGAATAASAAAATAAATAAARVASRVAAVATAAATAAVEAESLIREQLAKDESALALQLLTGEASLDTPRPAGRVVADPFVVAEELRHGISAHELRLHYQPIMSLVTGQPVGVEALVRWQHPERGLLAPVHFIDMAEDTALVVPLGAWVLREACRTAVSLQGRSGMPLTVAVNLSGRQLSDPGLVPMVRAALDASGCDARRLVFEVTETALVTDMTLAVDSLQELQQLGAGVALDDFGTGYAPLLYLKQLGADDLKIDRSFVSGLGQDVYDTAIVASLISLAHNLGVRCVAEGVETLEQLGLLKQLGCDFAQGYLFCRPTDAGSLQVWLNQHMPTAVASASPQPAVRSAPARVAGMHVNGASPATIAAALNAEGSRSPSGRRWSATSVAHTLTLAAV